MDALTKKRTDRFRLLNLLYERTGGDRMAMEDMWELGAQLGLSRDETSLAAEYLVGEGLATHRALGGIIAMTHEGVVEVERALSEPNKPTHYFPPVVNIVHIQSMVGSQFQQGTTGSSQTQNQSISSNDMQAIQALVQAIRRDLDSLPLNGEAKSEAESELQTLEAQLRSSKPKSTILRESLQTLRNLIEGVASNGLAAALLPLFGPLAGLLG